MSFVSAGVERTQSTLCVCVCDTSEMNLFLYMKTRATYALVFCCFPSFSAGLTTDGTEKACPFCTDWIPISDWETVGPSLSIFQQQTSPIFFFLSLSETSISEALCLCVPYLSRGYYCCVMPAATLLFFIVFLLFIDRFYQFSFNGLFRVEWEKIKSQKPRWLQFCRLENLSVSIQFRLRLCIYLFNWFNSVWGIFLCFFYLKRPFFYLNILFRKKSCFLTETTVNPLLVRWIVGVGAELATFLVFLYRTDGGEIEKKKKEKKKSDRKERKKIRERMKEEGGGCAFAERAGS